MANEQSDRDGQLVEIHDTPAVDRDSSSCPFDDDGYEPDDSEPPEPDPPELTAENFKGFVYIAANAGLKDRVKIGFSVDPNRRLKPMNAAHDENFEVMHAFATSEPKRAEAVCLAALKAYRVNAKKELFAISAQPVTARYTCSVTGEDFEDFNVPALDAAEYLASTLTRNGILFEDVPGSAFSKKRR